MACARPLRMSQAQLPTPTQQPQPQWVCPKSKGWAIHRGYQLGTRLIVSPALWFPTVPTWTVSLISPPGLASGSWRPPGI